MTYIETRLASSRKPTSPATARGHHQQRRQSPTTTHEVAKQPRTTVDDLFRAQYTIPVPTTISEV